MDQSLRELYQDVILDHSRHPRHFGRLPQASHSGEGYNPLCGDRITLDLSLDDRNRIADIVFEGKGCAISQACAAPLTDRLFGRTVHRIEQLMGGVHYLVKGEESDDLPP